MTFPLCFGRHVVHETSFWLPLIQCSTLMGQFIPSLCFVLTPSLSVGWEIVDQFCLSLGFPLPTGLEYNTRRTIWITG